MQRDCLAFMVADDPSEDTRDLIHRQMHASVSVHMCACVTESRGLSEKGERERHDMA